MYQRPKLNIFLFILLIAISLFPFYANAKSAEWRNSYQDSGNNSIEHGDERGHDIKDVLENISARLDEIQNQLDTLDKMVIPCTLDRYIKGQCGKGNTPFDLSVTLCASASGQISISGRDSVHDHVHAEGGVGWTDGPDADLKEDIDVPTPPLPSRVSIKTEGDANINGQVCFEGVKVPIGQNIDPSVARQLLTSLQENSSQIQGDLLNEISGAGVPALNAATIASALQLRSKLEAKNYSGIQDPIAIFSDSDVTQLASMLPVGSRLQSVFQNPSELIPRLEATNSQICNQLGDLQSLTKMVGPVCSFTSDLPSVNDVKTAYSAINIINQNVQDIPNIVSSITHNSAPSVPPGHPICSTFPSVCAALSQ